MKIPYTPSIPLIINTSELVQCGAYHVIFVMNPIAYIPKFLKLQYNETCVSYKYSSMGILASKLSNEFF